jgi:predicted  nucleic acid-binding Zn-ribbon protein
VGAAAHASSVRTVRSLKRKLSNSLSPQSGPATADAGLRAQLSETREEKAKVEKENERLRDALTATKRQHTQSRNYRKRVADRVRAAEHDAADLRAELAERATDVEEELMCAYEQYEIEAIVDEADNTRCSNAPTQPRSS